MSPKRQERLTDTTKTRSTITSNVSLSEQDAQTTRAGYGIEAPTREDFEKLLSRAAKKRLQESPSVPD
jgi:hypothetical protein